MNRRILKTAAILIVILIIGVLTWIVFNLRTRKHGGKDLSHLGLNLVAKYEPLHLYIYADTSSRKKLPDYLVCQGNNDVFYRRNSESNTIETTHFENGDSVFVTRRDLNGKILMRTTSYDDNSGQTKYSYIDSSGNGLWNIFYDHSKGMYYVQSNFCWILRYKDTNQP